MRSLKSLQSRYYIKSLEYIALDNLINCIVRDYITLSSNLANNESVAFFFQIVCPCSTNLVELSRGDALSI